VSGNRPHLARLCAFGLPGAVLPAFSCTAHTARSRLGTTSDSKGPTESRVGRHDNRGTERSSSPHERATAILAPRAARFRRRSAGAIQNEPASRTARTVCGDASERDARLGTLRQPPTCPYALSDREPNTCSPASRPSAVGQSQTAGQGIARGDAPPVDTAEPGVSRSSGTQVVSQLGAAPARTTTVRPDSRDLGPPARPTRAADDGDTA
jgi:hypothetical protein